MNETLLSICITTYNRANYLGDCLSSIVEQFDNRELIDQIEIMISDNASADNTTDIIKGFSDQIWKNQIFQKPI